MIVQRKHSCSFKKPTDKFLDPMLRIHSHVIPTYTILYTHTRTYILTSCLCALSCAIFFLFATIHSVSESGIGVCGAGCLKEEVCVWARCASESTGSAERASEREEEAREDIHTQGVRTLR